MDKKSIIIQDTVYIYIEFSSDVKPIIDTESFQRLKNIRQLTVQHLYPSANHTRFEHSLGVMHLALRVFDRIKSELFPLTDEETDDEAGLRNHLLYASLLHDVGHAPLSHIGELFYDKEEIIKKIDSLIQKEEKKFSVDFLHEAKTAPHELMSCYVIIKKFRDKLDPCIDLEFIFRIICGCYYQKIRKVRNVIISIVNSDTFDVDKLDYLLRDNKMVGYIGPQIDIERLLKSVTIADEKDRISFTQMGISAIQRVIDCRDNLYLWVYNHHTVVYTDYLYQECFIHFDKLHHGGGNGKDYGEKTPLRNLFSCEAIADDCVSDAEALSAINRAAKITREHKNENKTYSVYTEKLIKQLADRQYLKPLWKTLNQYDQFLEKCGCTNKEQKTELTKKIGNKDYRRQLVREIRSELGKAPGELFVIVRENKFYEYSVKNFKIKHYNKFLGIKNLLPGRNYDEKYEKTAFYVFCDAGSKEKVEELLIKKLRGVILQQEFSF
jgi:HD superfamily phosphohydrolase